MTIDTDKALTVLRERVMGAALMTTAIDSPYTAPFDRLGDFTDALNALLALNAAVAADAALQHIAHGIYCVRYAPERKGAALCDVCRNRDAANEARDRLAREALEEVTA